MKVILLAHQLMLLASLGCWEALKRPAEGWTANALVTHIRDTTTALPVVDPEAILSEPTALKLRTIIRSIRQIPVAFLLVSKIAPALLAPSVKLSALKLITNQLLADIPGLAAVRERGLVLVHSVFDEQELWWAAPDAQALLDDPVIARLKKSPRRDLGVHDINKAFLELFSRLRAALQQKPAAEKVRLPGWLWVAALLVVAGLFLNRGRTGHILTSRMEKIRTLERQPIEIDRFMKETCALCLKSLRYKIESDRLGHKHRQFKHPAFNTPKTQPDPSIPEEEQQQAFVYDSDTFIMDDCGHLFHGACLKIWGRYSDNCPLCELVGATDRTDAKLSKSNLGHTLTGIQQILQRGRLVPEAILFMKSHDRMPGFLDFLFDDKQEKTNNTGAFKSRI